MADLIQTRLPDNADLGSSVIQVQAYDSDHGINGELRYSILHGNKDDMFVIDPILGNIILAKELDLNSQITEFMLMIKASDQSIDDKKSATIPVHILLTSGNNTFLYYLDLYKMSKHVHKCPKMCKNVQKCPKNSKISKNSILSKELDLNYQITEFMLMIFMDYFFLIWTCPKQIGPAQKNLDGQKSFWIL